MSEKVLLKISMHDWSDTWIAFDFELEKFEFVNFKNERFVHFKRVFETLEIINSLAVTLLLLSIINPGWSLRLLILTWLISHFLQLYYLIELITLKLNIIQKIEYIIF